jgi:acetyltransferase-like isoleucine patch superfamily enzyme
MAEGSVLGANSLLKESTEPWTIYVGSPARPIKIRDKESILKSARKLGYE